MLNNCLDEVHARILVLKNLYFACCAILLTSLQAERKISLCTSRPDFNHCLSARLLSRLASRSWGPTAQNQGEGGRLETLRWVAGACWSRRFCSRRCSYTAESVVQKSSLAWRSDRKELWSMAAMFLASIYTAWGGGLKNTEQWSDWRVGQVVADRRVSSSFRSDPVKNVTRSVSGSGGWLTEVEGIKKVDKPGGGGVRGHIVVKIKITDSKGVPETVP